MDAKPIASTGLPRVVWIMILAIFALLLGSCAASNVAATVNGTEITDDEVLGLAATDDESATVDAGQFRNLLTNVIVTEAMLSTAEDDLGLGDLSSPESVDAYLAEVSEEDTALLANVASDPNLSEDAVDLVTVQLNLRTSVIGAVTAEDDFINKVWQNDQNALVQVCARHILVGTQEEEAAAAKERIEAGEDFSAVATEVSLDTQSVGGALPCPSAPGDFPPPLDTVFATAPVGELTEPVETQFGWHIVLVDSREGPQTIEELAGDPIRWIPQAVTAAAWTDWLNGALADADIEVRSQIGVWSPTANAIAPPPPSP